MKGRRRWPRPSFSLVAEADILAKVPVCITTARPVKTWKADTVTLLRRAIHTTSPGSWIWRQHSQSRPSPAPRAADFVTSQVPLMKH